MIVPAVIVILAGLALIVVAVASWQERLPRNALAGVRTPTTMRSDQAFKVANKVAAPLTAAGGVVLLLGGVLAALLGKSSAGPVLIGCALACAALCSGGAIKGVRTARTL
jgi:uncharacterized membrane protein